MPGTRRCCIGFCTVPLLGSNLLFGAGVALRQLASQESRQDARELLAVHQAVMAVVPKDMDRLVLGRCLLPQRSLQPHGHNTVVFAGQYQQGSWVAANEAGVI